jgi:PilZ domain
VGFIDVLKGLIGKKNWDYSERRGKLRARCRIEAGLFVGNGLIGAEVRNISVTGMQLMCLGKVSKGAQVELRGVKQYNQAEIHSLHCRVEWVKKQTPGWLAGVAFLDSIQDMGRSWLYWELKEQNIRMIGANNKRKVHRVRCLLPARLTSRTQNLNARVTNLSPGGAMVQTMGEMMAKGETVTLRFGPHEELPKISVKATIASVHVEGAPTYGLQFMSYEAGDESKLKLYLDFFFRE